MKFLKTSLRPKAFFLPMLVFSVAFTGYFATPRSSQVYSDSRWSIHLALSIIREGNLDLDEYSKMITPEDYAIQTWQGHIYSFYPIGSPLLAVPFVLAYNFINSHTFALVDKIHPIAQEIIASFITAITAVLLYQISHLSLNIKQSLFVAFIFAFCTSAWSTASRALWQHGPTMLCLSLALYLLLLARDRPRLVQFVSLPLAYAYVIRPLNIISIVFFSLFVLLYYRKYFLRYLLWSLGIAIPFFLVNYATFGTFFQPQIYAKYSNVFSVPSIDRLLGPFISPSRGLFVYTPILLFSFFGIYLKLKHFRENYPQNMLDTTLAVIFIAHSLLVSSWFMWWGGYSIGARMLSDMIPFQIYFLTPVIRLIASESKIITPLRLVFLACLLVSFAVQCMGVATEALWAWNYIPTRVEYDQARLWDWSDPPFLRGLTWLENIIPPNLGVEPAEINIECTVGTDEKKCKTSIELFTWPRQEFNWEANPPPGVKVFPVKGQNLFVRSRLAIHLAKTDYSPGVYNLGELKISAVHTDGPKLTDTISVPIFLHVIPPVQK